jgi:hypothetical protein
MKQRKRIKIIIIVNHSNGNIDNDDDVIVKFLFKTTHPKIYYVIKDYLSA